MRGTAVLLPLPSRAKDQHASPIFVLHLSAVQHAAAPQHAALYQSIDLISTHPALTPTYRRAALHQRPCGTMNDGD